ncbi:MAG: rubrerythrin family protein [Bacteroidota bacterium]|nr:rubrerythrin family protein [Bacteroidota bacterium]
MKKFFVVLLAVMIVTSITFAKNPTAPMARAIEDVKNAIVGESTASAKYAAYAKKAKEEGYTKVSLLFEAASKAEAIHAGNHKAALEQLGDKSPVVDPKFAVKSTKENLEDAIKGESYEIATMYPEFMKDANEAKANIALLSFNYAYQTEQKHKAMYTNALKALNEKNEKTLPSQYQVCPTCGNTYEGTAPARCGISMTPRERFLTIM